MHNKLSSRTHFYYRLRPFTHSGPSLTFSVSVEHFVHQTSYTLLFQILSSPGICSTSDQIQTHLSCYMIKTKHYKHAFLTCFLPEDFPFYIQDFPLTSRFWASYISQITQCFYRHVYCKL